MINQYFPLYSMSRLKVPFVKSAHIFSVNGIINIILHDLINVYAKM